MRIPGVLSAVALAAAGLLAATVAVGNGAAAAPVRTEPYLATYSCSSDASRASVSLVGDAYRGFASWLPERFLGGFQRTTQHRLCRDERSEACGGGVPAECLAWSGVELGGNQFQVRGGVHGQVGALGEPVAQQPVGVLVRWSLPRGVRVSEVDRQVQRRRDLLVQRHLAALVPRQGPA